MGPLAIGGFFLLRSLVLHGSFTAMNFQDGIAADLAAKKIEAETDARKQASAIIFAEQGRSTSRSSGRCSLHR